MIHFLALWRNSIGHINIILVILILNIINSIKSIIEFLWCSRQWGGKVSGSKDERLCPYSQEAHQLLTCIKGHCHVTLWCTQYGWLYLCRLLILSLFLCFVFTDKGTGTTECFTFHLWSHSLTFWDFVSIFLNKIFINYFGAYTVSQRSLPGSLIPCPHIFREGRYFLLQSHRWKYWNAHFEILSTHLTFSSP